MGVSLGELECQIILVLIVERDYVMNSDNRNYVPSSNQITITSMLIPFNRPDALPAITSTVSKH